MYGAVRATSRRLGVRHAPIRRASGVGGSGVVSTPVSSYLLPRRNAAATCRWTPPKAPDGRQVGDAASPPQSHVLLAHVCTVGTCEPVCPMPMLWNLLSENRGVLWQSMHDARPTNSFRPRTAAGVSAVEVGPC